MEFPDFRLDDQVALVTGASMGIGYGIAKALANAGAKVAVAARSVEALEKLSAEIRETGGEAQAFQMDVSDVSNINTTMAKVQQHFGRLDILVNNAGLGANHPAVDVTEPNIDYDNITPGMTVCDVIPNPPQTPFLNKAAAQGAVTLDGLGMLVYQGVIGFKMWTGVDAPIEVMHRALSEVFGL